MGVKGGWPPPGSLRPLTWQLPDTPRPSRGTEPPSPTPPVTWSRAAYFRHVVSSPPHAFLLSFIFLLFQTQSSNAASFLY